MNKILIVFLLIISFGCSEQNKDIGYYEPKYIIWDQEINKINFSYSKYKKLNGELTEVQINDLIKILDNNELHLKTGLGTCEITGAFILEEKIIYTTCGNAQLFVCDSNGQVPILLNENGIMMLQNLLSRIKR